MYRQWRRADFDPEAPQPNPGYEWKGMALILPGSLLKTTFLISSLAMSLADRPAGIGNWFPLPQYRIRLRLRQYHLWQGGAIDVSCGNKTERVHHYRYLSKPKLIDFSRRSILCKVL